MVRYSYSTYDNEVVDRFYPMGKQPKSIRLPDGRVAHRDYTTANRGTPGNWPMVSEAIAFHPRLQSKEFYDKSCAAGVPTLLDSEGRAILNNRKHRRDVLRWLKMHDKDAGYGDTT